MSHSKKEKFGKTKWCNGVDISDMTRLLSSEKWNKIGNNPGVIKLAQDCPKHNNKEEGRKSGKVGNRNGTCNNLNMNTDITQAAIKELQTSQTGDNSIPYQLQMSHMGRQ